MRKNTKVLEIKEEIKEGKTYEVLIKNGNYVFQSLNITPNEHRNLIEARIIENYQRSKIRPMRWLLRK